MEKGNKLFHKIDRYLGVPITVGLGLLRMRKKFVPQNIKRIAILNIGSIGDNVLMSAAILDLKKQFPDAQIIAFTGSTNFDVVTQIDGLESVVKLPITNPVSTIKALLTYSAFDILIDFGPWPRLNSIYSFFLPAKFKIGFNSIKQFRHYVYDYAVLHSNKVHEIENYRALISLLVPNPESKPMIKNSTTEASKQLVASAGSYCIIHAWPGGYKSYLKEWPGERWLQLVDKITNRFDGIIFTGAPADVEKTDRLLAEIKLKTKANNVISVAGKIKLRETIDLIANCKMIFSVNTGISHIAAAFDKPQVCLHGPTDVNRWRPYSDNTTCVVPSEGRYGYLNYGYEYELGDGNTMEKIDVERVYRAFESFQLNNVLLS